MFVLNITLRMHTKGIVRRICGPSVSVMEYDHAYSTADDNEVLNFDLLLIPYQSPLQWNLMVY